MQLADGACINELPDFRLIESRRKRAAVRAEDGKIDSAVEEAPAVGLEKVDVGGAIDRPAFLADARESDRDARTSLAEIDSCCTVRPETARIPKPCFTRLVLELARLSGRCPSSCDPCDPWFDGRAIGAILALVESHLQLLCREAVCHARVQGQDRPNAAPAMICAESISLIWRVAKADR